MTVPTISNLPTVPATSDPNFETEAPALFNHIKNTFVSEMNSAISFINSSTFDATVEFKNANFTAARNFLYMIDTSSGGVSVTLPANPSTGDQLLLMDQKRTFGTNNLTIGRNSQSINGAASDIVSKSTGALIRCIFQSSYGWTVDLYEGEWESGTSAGDLVYNGGKVGIGTSAPSGKLDVNTGVMSGNVKIGNFDNVVNGNNTSQLGNGTKLEFIADTNPRYSNHDPYTVAYVKAEYDGTDFDTKTGDTALTFATYDGYAGASNGVLSEKMRITSAGNVGIGTSAPESELHIKARSNRIPVSLAANELDDNSVFRVGLDTGDSSIYFAYGNAGDAIMQVANSSGGTAQDLFINPFGGRVGIGTNSPSGKLEIAGDKDATNLIVGAPLHTVSGGGLADYSELLFDNNYTAGTSGTAYIRHYANSHQNSEGALFFGTTSSTGTTSSALVIRGDGNVGIGVGSPARKLTLYQSDSDGSFLQFANQTTGALITDGSHVGINNSEDLEIAQLETGKQIQFWNGGTRRLVIDSAGDVEVKTGNLVIGTAGKGIDFSATSGTGTSELLTDYEEGNWTPTIEATGTAPTVTYTVNTGSYVKIGRMVHVTMSIVVNAFSGGTGDIRIAGLPFNSISSDSNKYSSSGAIGYASGFTTKPHVALLISTDTNKIRLYDDNNGAIAISTLNGGEVIRLTISYQTA